MVILALTQGTVWSNIEWRFSHHGLVDPSQLGMEEEGATTEFVSTMNGMRLVSNDNGGGSY